VKTLAIVIPVYNGAHTIGPLVELCTKELADVDHEFVLVNDGSRDDSERVCEALARERSNLTFISLRKNFGEHNAVMCGLNFISAEYAAIIDDDFQNPPSEIIKLLNEARRGYDVVYSYYSHKQHSWFRNAGSWLHNRIATFLLNKPKGLYLSSFKVIRREVVDEIVKYRGPFPYVDGLIFRVTNNFSKVLVEHSPRAEGRSNYTVGKLVSLTLNMFLNFSIKPLRIGTLIGLIMFALSVCAAIYVVIWKLYHPTESAGWSSQFIAVTMFSGTQLMFLGLLGEYLGKCYLDQNGTPQWVVKKRVS
jgi:glycosyltransferase involved in cell wall biosynthesis